ncbi:MAG: AraC family transcriptional regulator [Fibrobacteria bacterium]
MEKSVLAGGYSLFRYFSDMAYFAKDLEGRFIAANSEFIEMAGLKKAPEILGKTDFDIWPRFLAELYVKDDTRVLETSEPTVNRIELVLCRDRSSDWFTTTKVPLLDASGSVIGLEGVCRYFKKANAPLNQFISMPGVIDFITQNYPNKIDIPALAAMISLSVKQFERKFKQEYGEVPVRYIQRIRLDAARQLLAMSRLPIAQISRETGFYDSSHFAHQFQKYTGLSPTAFRNKHLQTQAPVPKPDLQSEVTP